MPRLLRRFPDERHDAWIDEVFARADVVPVGDPAAWSGDPFGAEIRDGWLWGRGSTDMKSGVAAFVAAAIRTVTETPPDGAVILAITGVYIGNPYLIPAQPGGDHRDLPLSRVAAARALRRGADDPRRRALARARGFWYLAST